MSSGNTEDKHFREIKGEFLEETGSKLCSEGWGHWLFFKYRKGDGRGCEGKSSRIRQQHE